MGASKGIISVNDDNIQAFLAAPFTLIVLTTSSCGYCGTYLDTVEAMVQKNLIPEVVVGTIVLDRPGVTRFKRDNPWLVRLQFVPYNLVFHQGRQVDSFATARTSYLLMRICSAYTGYSG